MECFWGDRVPAVSLRSTAGYNLCSLREQYRPRSEKLGVSARLSRSENLCVPARLKKPLQNNIQPAC